MIRDFLDSSGTTTAQRNCVYSFSQGVIGELADDTVKGPLAILCVYGELYNIFDISNNYKLTSIFNS